MFRVPDRSRADQVRAPLVSLRKLRAASAGREGSVGWGWGEGMEHFNAEGDGTARSGKTTRSKTRAGAACCAATTEDSEAITQTRPREHLLRLCVLEAGGWVAVTLYPGPR